MNVSSLFTGIGGLDLGLEQAGHRIVFQCEKDAYRRRVLARHWPGVPCFEDVREVAQGSGWWRPRHLAGEPRGSSSTQRNGSASSEQPPVLDLLCGGFPCQDLSVAGRRAGLQGERSGLFFEFARIADALLSDGGWVLIENVPGLLSSHGGRDFAVLLATLAELGFYDLAWRVLDSRYLGVPQRRRRVFILARRSRGRCASEVLLEPESGGGDFEAGREARQGSAGSVADGAQAARSLTASERWDGETEDFIAKPPGAKHPSQGGYRNDLDHDTYIHFDQANTPNTGVVGPSAHANGVRATPRLSRWLDRCAFDPKPDGPRYAACGDAVTTFAAEWIGRRLNAVQSEAMA